jgi:hypothetical protein
VLPFYRIEQHSNSLSNLFRLPAFLLTLGGRSGEGHALAVSVLSSLSALSAAVVSAAAAVAAFLQRSLWKRGAALLCLVLLLPNNTFDYMLILFLPLLAMALCEGELRDQKYVVLLTLSAVVPKSYFFLDVTADVSIQTVLNPLIMVSLLSLLAAEGWKNRRKGGKTGRE